VEAPSAPSLGPRRGSYRLPKSWQPQAVWAGMRPWRRSPWQAASWRHSWSGWAWAPWCWRCAVVANASSNPAEHPRISRTGTRASADSTEPCPSFRSLGHQRVVAGGDGQPAFNLAAARPGPAGRRPVGSGWWPGADLALADQLLHLGLELRHLLGHVLALAVAPAFVLVLAVVLVLSWGSPGGRRPAGQRETARTPGPAAHVAPSGRTALYETEDVSRAERASASSWPPIAVIDGDGARQGGALLHVLTRRQRPSNQDPPGSRVLLGGSWPSWAPVTNASNVTECWSLFGLKASIRACSPTFNPE
jgi:hypothetical protein